jgi:hypothetical protein
MSHTLLLRGNHINWFASTPSAVAPAGRPAAPSVSTAVGTSPWLLRAQPPASAPVVDRLTALVREAQTGGPDPAVEKEWRRFVAFYVGAADPLPPPPAPLPMLHVALYLWQRAKEVGNSVSWTTWTSHIIAGATAEGYDRPSREWFTALKLYSFKCAKAVVPKHTSSAPLGHPILLQMAEFLRASGGGTLVQRATLAHTAMSFGLTLRPGDLAQANGLRATAVSVRVRHLKIYAPGETSLDDIYLPNGGVVLSLPTHKGAKLSNPFKTKKGVTIKACSGSGTTTCLVNLLTQHLAASGLTLGDPACADAPIFAQLLASGERDPAGKVISQRQYNANLRELLMAAGVKPDGDGKLPTARGARHGRTTELDATPGVAREDLVASGAWAPDRGTRKNKSVGHYTHRGEA